MDRRVCKIEGRFYQSLATSIDTTVEEAEVAIMLTGYTLALIPLKTMSLNMTDEEEDEEVAI